MNLKHRATEGYSWSCLFLISFLRYWGGEGVNLVLSPQQVYLDHLITPMMGKNRITFRESCLLSFCMSHYPGVPSFHLGGTGRTLTNAKKKNSSELF